jgi:predicted transcriptional regulator
MITLKEKLVSQIEATEDELLLKQISILLSEDITSISTLTKVEKEAIELGLDDLKNGRTISDEDVQKEWNSWL